MGNKTIQFDPTAVEILRASVPHVPFDGWCEAALLTGAGDCGHDAEAVRTAFPRGATDAIALHSRLADQSMVDAFLELRERPEKVHLTIRQLVLLRLEIAQPDKDAIRRAVSVLAMPVNAKLSAKLLYETVDSMWRAAGQRDTNFSFYSKRGTLAAVYSATMLAWLADNSINLDKTIGFLDRRLADVAQIPRMTKPVRKFMSAGQRFAGTIMQGFVERRSR
jgi:ubiquinone biosynthesis protein COQ9